MSKPIYKKFYFNQAEADWIASKTKGYVRRLVQSDMEGTLHPLVEVRAPEVTPEERDRIEKWNEKAKALSVAPREPSPRVVRGNLCPKCGSLLIAGSCKVCR